MYYVTDLLLVTGLIAIIIGLITHDTKRSLREMTIGLSLIVLSFTIRYGHQNRIRTERLGLEMEKLVILKTPSIPDFTTLSNGLYYAFSSYRNLDGDWLTIMHRAHVRTNGNNVIVVGRDTNQYPVLINTGLPLTKWKFAEIVGEGTNKCICPHYPSSKDHVYKSYGE